jgi:hypothetical protein
MTNDVKRTVKGRRPKFNTDPAIDNVHGMVMALTAEVAVLHDRLDTVERITEAKGIMLTEEIEKFEPDRETLLAREQWRQQLLKRMFYLLREQASDVTEGSTEESYTAFLDEIA